MYPTAIGVQETELCVLGQGHSASAQVGVTTALTGVGTDKITKVLIVVLRTLAPTVTDVCLVQTDSGATTAVEIRAGGRRAALFILVIWTVMNIVTAHVDRQAVART